MDAAQEADAVACSMVKIKPPSPKQFSGRKVEIITVAAVGEFDIQQSQHTGCNQGEAFFLFFRQFSQGKGSGDIRRTFKILAS